MFYQEGTKPLNWGYRTLLLSQNGFNHGGTSFDLFIQIEIAIGIEIEFSARWI